MITGMMDPSDSPIYRIAYRPDGNPNQTSLRLSSSPFSLNNIPMISNLIDHVALIVDSSSSINTYGLTDTVIQVIDNQISYLAKRSKELDREVRVSVYTFADKPSCLIWDKDVFRLPSLREHYHPNGNTALIDAALMAIAELKEIPQRHGDHSHLIILISDGEENKSKAKAADLSNVLKGLDENWTFAGMVPNQLAVHALKNAGVAAGNISVWDTTARGLQEVGEVVRQATDTFMRARATGVRGTKSLFSLDATKLSAAAVKNNLQELSPSEYDVYPVSKKVAIKPFVEGWRKGTPYQIGSAYYPVTKAEKIQGHKQICIQNKRSGKVYTGAAARQLLGLPNHEVKVEPASHPDFQIYSQSTSTNRNLVPGTNLLVMK